MKGKKVFRLSNRAYIYSAVAAVIIFAVILCSFMFRKNGQTDLFFSPANGGAIVLKDGENTGKTITGKSISCQRTAFDGESAAVLMADGSSYSLYFVKNGSYKKIADNCTGEIVYMQNKADIVYLNSDDTLFAGKTVVSESVKCFSSAPDSSAVIYVKENENAQELYLFTKGTSTLVGQDYIPVAVSSDGNDIYVIAPDGAFCILNKDGTMKSKLCSDVATDSFIFSEDLSVVVFSDGEYTYMSIQGMSRIRLFEGDGSPEIYGMKKERLDSTGTAFVVNSDLSSGFYSSSAENSTVALYYVNEDSSVKSIASSVESFVVTDFDMISYLDSQGRIYAYNGKDNELVVNNAESFFATSQNRYIYYMTSGGEVYSVKNNNNQLLAKGVYRYYLHSDDRLYLLMSDSKLYSVKGVKRSDVIAENVNFCISQGEILYYACDFDSDKGIYSLYSTADGKNFSKVSENIVR